MKKSFQVCQLFGIPIQLQYGWFCVFGIFSWLLAYTYFPHKNPHFSTTVNVILGVAGTLFLFLSILLHELAHSLVAKKTGLSIESINLFILGGVAKIEGEPDTPIAEFKIAISGPAFSFLFALVFFILATINLLPFPAASAIFHLLFTFNVTLALFNLTPAFPMDGGRILHAGIWHWKRNLKDATVSASIVSQTIAITLILTGTYLTITNNIFNGIWLIVLGYFLRNISIKSYMHVMMRLELNNKTVQEFMTRNIKTIESHISLEEAKHSFIFPYHYKSFPVLSESQLCGLLLAKEVKRLSNKTRKEYTVSDVMVPIENLSFAPSTTNAFQAWQEIRDKKKERLLIVDKTQLIGILTASDMERKIGKI